MERFQGKQVRVEVEIHLLFVELPVRADELAVPVHFEYIRQCLHMKIWNGHCMIKLQNTCR